MVHLKKKTISDKEYYYLEHTIRVGKSFQKKEKYLGSEIPKDLEKIKITFAKEIFQDKWHNILNEIKKRYTLTQKSLPLSAKEKELETFMVKFTYDSQKIEGSKLTLRETANLLEKGLSPKEKPIRDIKEAEKHRIVFYEMLGYTKDLSLEIILLWHKKLFQDTKPDIAGKIRTHGVAISGSRFMPPTPVELTFLLREFFSWYNKNNDKIHPVELAALVHLKFVSIHPFGDGNGRISRLMMNFILQKFNYPLLNISYENRNSYYRALERAQIKNEEQIFIQWLIRRYLKEQKIKK
ncbi:Fic family protein [Candidatus Woesearchaeota archaeon]|nr:Fic family protein [Candidatus Woesearchaeota archaeon]